MNKTSKIYLIECEDITEFNRIKTLLNKQKKEKIKNFIDYFSNKKFLSFIVKTQSYTTLYFLKSDLHINNLSHSKIYEIY